MKKLMLLNPFVEDILLFLCPGPVCGDFSFIGCRNEKLTMIREETGWVIRCN
jgi:hypothetical protein